MADAESPGHPSSGIVTQLIEEEHARLAMLVNRLDAQCAWLHDATVNTCMGCLVSTADRCAEKTEQALSDTISFMLDHFIHEEGLMKPLPVAMLSGEDKRSHAEDHANISERLAQLANAAARAEPLHETRTLSRLLRRWVSEHIAHFDDHLMDRLRSATDGA